MSVSYYEYAGNLHMHTPYSDGAGSHEQIAQAALAAGLDFVVVTDHNILVRGVEGYYGDDQAGYVLLLTGEEVHDRERNPQVNHLLVYGVENELCQCARDPQELINVVNAAGGLSFLAHPHDPPLDLVHEPPIIWEDLQVQGYTGIELWNYMSSFKEILSVPLIRAIRRVFRPEEVVIGPDPKTIALWDDLLSKGHRVIGIGNADAHGTTYHFGPLSHTIFPYDFLFSCVNTRILTQQPFTGDWLRDKQIMLRALKSGNAYVSYDLPGNPRGFRFSANSSSGTAIMGGSLRLGTGVTLQAIANERAHIKLIRNGEIVAESTDRENLTFTARRGGAYRVEVWRRYLGKPRCWIISNPIYVEDGEYTVKT